MAEPYPDFFRRVTGNAALPYQLRYAGNPFAPTLIIVPTGLGKTDTVLVPWLYAQAAHDVRCPTRLILVLPRQNLTRQTAANACSRRDDAGLVEQVRVLELMGGSGDNDETLQPWQPAIIVCTQDMYFSRALNRGYARRPPRWPIDFALYNQDCLVVHDEVQLMDDALATSTQLAAFRELYGTYGPAISIWMSATVNTDWLRTINFGDLPLVLRLENDDRAKEIVQKRIHAAKAIKRAPEPCSTPAGCAAFALEQHRPGTRTLVIVNTVSRAREIYRAIRTRFAQSALLHSRFRPVDRARAEKALAHDGTGEGQILVATQVLEAGVDITSRLLISDIAPWGSMVQRFGRVNRRGDDTDAEIFWIENPAPASTKTKNPRAPYEPAEIDSALDKIRALSSASPDVLPEENGPAPWKNVLRKTDLLDLFDTTPDLSGNQLDVSRFIRDTEERNVYVAWREWENDGPPKDSLPDLESYEMCPVPIGEMREFMTGKKHAVYSWNFATERWSEVDRDQLYSGMLLVTRCSEGGYAADEGWSPESKARVEPVATDRPATETEGDSTEKLSFPQYRQTLTDHTRRVVEEMQEVLRHSPLDTELRNSLVRAAERHDWGKAHPVFQKTMHRNEPGDEMLAKQIGKGKHERDHFRHELASALAMLATGCSDLEAYIAAAHHGRIRMSIRSMPGETEKSGTRVARGIQEGDILPTCTLVPGLDVPQIALGLSVMDFGAAEGSWTERVLKLREEFGPFRLAFLEALLRAADVKASEEPHLEGTACAN